MFIAQYTGIDPLSADQYFIVLIASVLGSFGTAGVPGTAVVMATVVLSAAGLPLEAIGYLYRHRPRAGHDAHHDQRHRADAGAGAGGEGDRAAGPGDLRRGSSNVGLEHDTGPTSELEQRV